MNTVPPMIDYITKVLRDRWVPLPKSATPSRIHSNAQLYDFELSESEMDQLNALDRGTDGAVTWNPVNAA